MSLAYEIVEQPAEEPVSIELLKQFSRVCYTNQDAVIDTLIRAVRTEGETITQRQFVTATYRMCLDQFPFAIMTDSDLVQVRHPERVRLFPNQAIAVPKPPLQQVNSIRYRDSGTGDWVTLDADKYIVDTVSEPGRITPSFGNWWPTAQAVPNAVEIEFVAGYGDHSVVPWNVKQAIIATVQWMFIHRDDGAEKPDHLMQAWRSLSVGMYEYSYPA